MIFSFRLSTVRKKNNLEFTLKSLRLKTLAPQKIWALRVLRYGIFRPYTSECSCEYCILKAFYSSDCSWECFSAKTDYTMIMRVAGFPHSDTSTLVPTVVVYLRAPCFKAVIFAPQASSKWQIKISVYKLFVGGLIPKQHHPFSSKNVASFSNCTLD